MLWYASVLPTYPHCGIRAQVVLVTLQCLYHFHSKDYLEDMIVHPILIIGSVSLCLLTVRRFIVNHVNCQPRVRPYIVPYELHRLTGRKHTASTHEVRVPVRFPMTAFSRCDSIQSQAIVFTFQHSP